MLSESMQEGADPRMVSTGYGSQYWRDRAKEAREHAAQMTDMVSKNTMLGIAQSYDFLAWRAQEEQRDSEYSK
jgi:hypothetical protein